ncbi:MAG: TatD family hydrolase, partial [Acidimicrobiales bacterium]
LQEEYLGGEDGGGSGDAAALAAALDRAAAAGVRRMVCVGTGAVTSAAALVLARRSAAGELGAGEGADGGEREGTEAGEDSGRTPRLWATVGLHPHHASEGTEATTRLVEEAVAVGDGALVAVGECGLDYHYDHSPRKVQRRAFAEQVALAQRHGLALVIHARDAWADLFDVLAAEGVPERTILHCFTGGPDEARRCLDAGMYVSFSGIVTFKSAVGVRDAASVVPLGRLLVETDSPFLAPVPYRGKPNEPALVPLVGEAVAAVKGVAPAELAEATDRAAREVFGVLGGGS